MYRRLQGWKTATWSPNKQHRQLNLENTFSLSNIGSVRLDLSDISTTLVASYEIISDTSN